MTVSELGAVMFVGAHPDDETFVAAGVLAQAVQNGQRVACVTATKGEAGTQDVQRWPPERLGEIRAQEMDAAMAVLGVKDHTWLGYLDGTCEEVPLKEAVAKLGEHVARFRPDTILTFGPEGMTGHEDHKAMSKWVSLLVREMKSKPVVLHSVNTVEQYEVYLKPADEKLNIFFNIEEPRVVRREECDLLFDLPDDIRELKRRAMAAQPSQMERMLHIVAPDGMLSDGLAVEGFVLEGEGNDD